MDNIILSHLVIYTPPGPDNRLHTNHVQVIGQRCCVTEMGQCTHIGQSAAAETCQSPSHAKVSFRSLITGLVSDPPHPSCDVSISLIAAIMRLI